MRTPRSLLLLTLATGLVGFGPSLVNAQNADPASVAVEATDAVAQVGTVDAGLFTVTRSGGSLGSPLTVGYAFGSEPSAAAYGGRYFLNPEPTSAAGGSIVIPAGAVSATVRVEPAFDTAILGPQTVTLRLQTGSGYALAGTGSAVVQLLDTPLNAWKTQRFGSLAGARSAGAANFADAEGDGRVTLLEYALGSDPTRPDGALRQPEAGIEGTGPTAHLTLRVRRPRPAPPDLCYVAEGSAGLNAAAPWSGTPALAGPAVDNGDGTETATFRGPALNPAAPNDAAFMRLRVGTANSAFITMNDAINPSALRVAYSLDGTHWQTPPPVYQSPDGVTDVRDPSIAKLNGRYYVAHTAGSYARDGNFGVADHFGILVSDDLQTWTHLVDVPVGNIGYTSFTWAPEWFVDNDGSIYVYYARNLLNGWRLFYTRPLNAALTEWSSPQQVGGDMLGRGAIDGQVVRDGNDYLLCYRNYSPGGATDAIEIARGSSPTAFNLWKTGDWSGLGTPREAPCLVHLGGSRWRLYFSLVVYLLKGGNLAFSESEDGMQTWSPPQGMALSGHGTFLPLFPTE